MNDVNVGTMELSTVNKASNKIINGIEPPNGWELACELGNVISDLQITDAQKRMIGFHLPYVAHKVESFIDQADHRYHLTVSESHISIDTDATFHIVLLIKQEDYHTPEFLAAKIMASESLSTIEAISMRYTFTVAKEYFKVKYTENTYKLKYVYKVPYLFTQALRRSAHFQY